MNLDITFDVRQRASRVIVLFPVRQYIRQRFYGNVTSRA